MVKARSDEKSFKSRRLYRRRTPSIPQESTIVHQTHHRYVKGRIQSISTALNMAEQQASQGVSNALASSSEGGKEHVVYIATDQKRGRSTIWQPHMAFSSPDTAYLTQVKEFTTRFQSIVSSCHGTEVIQKTRDLAECWNTESARHDHGISYYAKHAKDLKDLAKRKNFVTWDQKKGFWDPTALSNSSQPTLAQQPSASTEHPAVSSSTFSGGPRASSTGPDESQSFKALSERRASQ